MAVVDAGENLFDEHSSVFLAEFSAGKNLVKELTTLTNLGDNIISFLILEELVHLDDVGVINSLENVDLVEEHSLFIFVHMRLAQDLDSSLSTGVSMYAESDLTESTFAKDFTDSVEVTELAFSLTNELGSINLNVNHLFIACF